VIRVLTEGIEEHWVGLKWEWDYLPVEDGKVNGK